MNIEKLKTPPHSIEAEQSVLGAILILQKADCLIGEIMDMLRPEMFYNISNKIIFAAMLKIGAKNEIDLITVNELLERSGKDDQAGGIAYLGELARNTPSSKNALAYCEIIQERYLKRRLIGDMSIAIDALYNGESASEIISMVEHNISTVDLSGKYEPNHIKIKLDGWLNVMQSRCNNDRSAVGLKTGLKTLDDQIGGIKNNWLVILAGRPSNGKTLAAQIINSNVSRTLPSLFFTMEMSSDEVTDRYMGIMAGISVKSLTSGLMSKYELSRASTVLQDLSNDHSKIYYDETPALSLNQIRYRVKSTIKKLGQIGLVTIDYLGLMQKDKADRDDLAIGIITKGLKQLAKETGTPILLLVQANRGTDQVARPTMSNLYGSSAIEADADLVLFAHREEVNNPETNYKGVLELIPAKFRHGSCHNTTYIGRKCDEDGGYYYCLDAHEIGLIDHQEEDRKKQSDKEKPRRGATMAERYGRKST